MNGEAVVCVEGLYKRYGNQVAVDGISFQVRGGEIFGIVGPNGAGKTTMVECIEGLRRPDAGQVRVLSLDPCRDAAALRERIGVQLQSAGLPNRIRVDEAVHLFASFYRRPACGDELLARLGLGEARRQFVARLSGGQRQRLFVVLALINRPEVVFLDELTTGLDPQGRRATWDLVREVRARGATVVLTTHFMDEAEQLCDRVAVVDHGRIIALDTPAALVRSLGHEARIVFEPACRFEVAILGVLDGVRRVALEGEKVVVSGGSLAAVINTLEAAGVGFRDLRTEQPDLEDVFLSLTGHGSNGGGGSCAA